MDKHDKSHLFYKMLALYAAMNIAFCDPGMAIANNGGNTDIDGYSMDSPVSALLTPSGGRLEARREATVTSRNGSGHISFIIPADAGNLQLSAEGQTITRWSSSPVILKNSSALAMRRENIEKERASLSAKLVTIKAQLAVWQAQTAQASAQELEQRQTMMRNQMPALAEEQENLENRLKLVQRELDELRINNAIGQQIEVTLAGMPEDGKKVIVSYSYDFPGCGWQAIYNFNANTDKNDNIIETRLLAEVWQYTGLDWEDTQITLVTRGNGPREPAPLPEWIVDSSRPKPVQAPQARMLNARATGMAEDSGAAKLQAAPVTADSSGVYGTWLLSAKGLPEGRSRLLITSDTWKAPLQWLARPTRGDNRVWITASCDLPHDSVWPAGLAEYSVNGQNVGNGTFSPRAGMAKLYFGADPRVQCRTILDSKKLGESGIINASKNWTWAWTYILSNEHDREIKIRVERPAPMIVDEKVTVSYNNKPKAETDEKEHMLFWEVTAPAHNKTEIMHSVTISSPTKLPLLPNVP